MSLFSEVSLPAFSADGIEAGFSGFSLLRRGFNEANLPGLKLIGYPDNQLAD